MYKSVELKLWSASLCQSQPLHPLIDHSLNDKSKNTLNKIICSFLSLGNTPMSFRKQYSAQIHLITMVVSALACQIRRPGSIPTRCRIIISSVALGSSQNLDTWQFSELFGKKRLRARELAFPPHMLSPRIYEGLILHISMAVSALELPLSLYISYDDLVSQNYI